MEVLVPVRPDIQKLRSLEDDPRWMAMQRILISTGFAKSFRLIALLTYICRCALEDRSDEITEQQIGFHVFERAADYNPGDDNIVRTTARQLRQKLAVYYQEEGASEQLRIEIPRGGYHPIFITPTEQPAILADPQPVSLEAIPSTAEPSLPVASGIHLTRSGIVLGLLMAMFGAAISLLLNRLTHRSVTPIPAVMAEVLSPGRTTVFVAGDSGLNMYDNLARTQVSLGEYVSGDYLNTAAAHPPTGYAWPSLASRRYTSFVDMQLSDKLRIYGQERGVPLSIRFARDVHAEDLRHANVILAGSGAYNPWVSMFDNTLNFHLRYNGEKNAVTVLNAKPLPGEPQEFIPEDGDHTLRGYSHGFGYIALANNLEGDGKVLLIEGSTVAGVDAALQFVLSDSQMSSILKKLTAENGRIGSFEILLAANFIKSSSPDARILAMRTYK